MSGQRNALAFEQRLQHVVSADRERFEHAEARPVATEEQGMEVASAIALRRTISPSRIVRADVGPRFPTEQIPRCEDDNRGQPVPPSGSDTKSRRLAGR